MTATHSLSVLDIKSASLDVLSLLLRSADPELLRNELSARLARRPKAFASEPFLLDVSALDDSVAYAVVMGRLSRSAISSLLWLGLMWTAQVWAALPRVVALDWACAETAQALGVTPVGMSQLADYRIWSGEMPMPDSVVSGGIMP